MDVRVLFPSLYFSFHDFAGKEVTLTIRRVVPEELRTERGSETKHVIYFEEIHAKAEKAGQVEKQKRLVIGKTNGYDIGGAIGWEMATWPGKKITLYQGKARGGKDCIRAKLPPPAAASAPAPATPSDIPQPV